MLQTLPNVSYKVNRKDAVSDLKELVSDGEDRYKKTHTHVHTFRSGAESVRIKVGSRRPYGASQDTGRRVGLSHEHWQKQKRIESKRAL